MRIFTTAVAVAAAGAGLLAGGVATASTEVAAGGPPQYSATAWHDVNVRHCPSTSCTQAPGSPVLAGWTVGVYCWVHGESVTDFGYTNDVWLNIGRQDGGTQWSSAIYFAGDEYANLPQDARCADAPQPPTTTPKPTTTRPDPTSTPPSTTTRPMPTTTPGQTTTTRPAPTTTADPTSTTRPSTPTTTFVTTTRAEPARD
ncbi:hypothetical protein [Saccharothrix texasensis]|uniref:SH3 domain-containing protein n=1 Tax=Saccharothrix texasensis TaxID=103734 RepID=A0A3N1H993_9PSEU|nr:hypothetical protein [Saccharothrix texasensis]ROP39089.1 hypothetical protein EDD40_4461 [Saccharothrix texasensis]